MSLYCLLRGQNNHKALCETPAQLFTAIYLFTVLHPSLKFAHSCKRRVICICPEAAYFMLSKVLLKRWWINLKTFWQNFKGAFPAVQRTYACTSLDNKTSLAVTVQRFRHPAVSGGVNCFTWQTTLPLPGGTHCSWSADVGAAVHHAPKWHVSFLVPKLLMSNLYYCLKTP